jgi:hypothetical protein
MYHIDISHWLGIIPNPIVTEHFFSDSVIALSYVGLSLFVFMIFRHEAGFKLALGMLFATFIMLCGVTHVNSAIAEFQGYCESYASFPAHWKVATAVVSFLTFLLSWSLYIRLRILLGLSSSTFRNSTIADKRLKSLNHSMRTLDDLDRRIASLGEERPSDC